LPAVRPWPLSVGRGIRPGGYRRVAMSRCQLPITFTLDGEPVESVTRLLRAGPYVLVLQTTLPQRGLAVELDSTFVGHNAAPTHTTHLLLGPVGQPPHLAASDDPAGIVDPVNRPDSCVYAHCYELINLLAERGVDLAVAELPTQLVPLAQ